jgi:DNA-directed RNA polymerase specialized sigma subunit
MSLVSPTTLLAIDTGLNLAFHIYEKVQKMRSNPTVVTEEEADALIEKWQPLVDSIAEDIQNM